jgi:hypothetical protein
LLKYIKPSINFSKLYFKQAFKHLLIILALVLVLVYLLCSPCLLNDFNCVHIKNDAFGNQKFQQLIIHLIIRAFVVITSSLVYSFKGLHFKKTVNGLRKLLFEINGNKTGSKICRSLYWQILFFCFFVFFAIMGYVIGLHKVHKIGLIPAILISIAECYTEVLYSSTDFYVLYFTTYLVIIQKSFLNILKNYNNSPLALRDLIWIKTKFDAIQDLIDKISALLSPILLLVCCSILYDSVTCLYTTIISLQKSYFFGTQYIAGNIGVFGFFIRLLIICLSAERVINEVIIRNLRNFFSNIFSYTLQKNNKIFENIEKLNNFVDEKAERKVFIVNCV